ncbi:hypothetical protein GCM10012275_35210 [Longimycelium tulufanense]|uniref:DUF6545 domain-containing protein n=1 Tax=Longimycelium tulufanense TaxID=907463 RepID=A0A8J3FWN2_9PSEU|nr:MAB_1171c family putative transporter [Longimycelium tulufanense]GGM61100.1 hypothetical protein GCM10012275_35210 [Longimycelium tulufanense]
MVDLLFLAVALVAYALAVLLMTSGRRGRRKPTHRPMTVILVALGSAFVFLAPGSQEVLSRILPSLGRLLSNVCTLVAAFSFLNLMLYVAHPADEVRARVRPRLVALLVALAVMVTAFLLSDPPEGLGLFRYHEQPMLAVYPLVYAAYLGAAVGDVFWLCMRSIRYSRRYLRIGLAVMAIGCTLGVAYLVHKVVLIVDELVAGTIAEPRCAGPFATVDCTFAVGMPALAVLGIILGAAVPAVGPRLESAVLWPSRWRAFRRLHPLWRALHDAFPEIALTSPQAVEGRIPRRDMDFRLYRRVIEIRDGLLLLHPYRDPAATAGHRARASETGLTDTDLDAAVEAAGIALALRRRAEGIAVVEGVVPAEAGPEHDLGGETAWLTRVSRAFAREAASVEPAR